MGADDVAVLRTRHRADHRPAFARAGSAPVDREVKLGARCRVRGNPDMVNPIGASHRNGPRSNGPRNGDGPPKQTGLFINGKISSAAAADGRSIVESRPDTTAIYRTSRWTRLAVNCGLEYGMGCRRSPRAPGKFSMRVVNVAAAQMGPIQKADSREAVVKRMIALMDEAKAKGADLIVYPELALTTFFPRWYMEDQAEVDAWFEREMPNAATRPLFERAARAPDGDEFRLCRADAGRASFQHLHPHRPLGKDRRQIPQGSSAGPFGVRYRTRLPASGEALFRARRSRLSSLAQLWAASSAWRSAMTAAGRRPIA